MARNRSESVLDALGPKPLSAEEARISGESVTFPRAASADLRKRQRMECPLCDVSLPPDRLKVHLSRAHGI